MSKFFKLDTSIEMDKRSLAEMCRALRSMKELSQEAVAEMIGERRGKPISKQSVSVAENPDKAGYEALRIEIIEALSGRELDGPYWKFREEPAGEASHG